MIRIIPLLVASLLLGAHFWRAGNLVLAVICLLVPLLLLVRQSWSRPAVQLYAYLGAGVWLYTTITIVQERLQWGLPWLRVVLILGTVAAFTAWAGLLLKPIPMKEEE